MLILQIHNNSTNHFLCSNIVKYKLCLSASLYTRTIYLSTQYLSSNFKMANTQNSVQPAAPVSNQATSYSRNKQMAAPIWSALFKGHQNFATKRRPLGLLDLPAEIIDMILGYTCSGWAVTIRQIPYTFSRPQSYIFIEPHAQSAKIGPALMSLASTNSLLREHLRRCLYSPALFSGYTQLIGLDHQSLASPRMQEFVLAASISTLWPRVTPEMFLNWALSATTVLEIDSEIWETQYRFADVWHVCRKLRKLILVDSLDTVFSTSTVKESRDFFVRKVTDVGRFSSRWSRGMKELAARGIRVTLRTSRVHPSRIRGWTLSQQYPKDFHPMVSQVSVSILLTPYDSSVHTHLPSTFSPQRTHHPCLLASFFGFNLMRPGSFTRHQTNSASQPSRQYPHSPGPS